MQRNGMCRSSRNSSGSMGISKLRFVRAAIALAGAVCWPGLHAAAQFGPLLDLETAPLAKTQEEFDAYLEILAAAGDRQRIAEARDFLAAYPESALQGHAAVYQMEAHRALDDVQGVLGSGERVLKLLPENLRALLTLATAIPNAVQDATQDQALLERAERYATRALAVMESKEIPRSIRLAEWKRFRAGMAAEAHEALGHIAVKRGRIEHAVSEFELAIRLNPDPEGRQWFRLGAAYAGAGRASEAATALRRAVALGPELIRQRAEQELNSLSESGPATGRN